MRVRDPSALYFLSMMFGLYGGLTACGPTPQAAASAQSELGLLMQLVDESLLPDGTIARGPIQVPKLPRDEYKKAHEVVKRMATDRVRELVADPANFNVVRFIHDKVRNQGTADGRGIYTGAGLAEGNLTVETYMKTWGKLADSLSPKVIDALRDPRMARLVDLLLHEQNTRSSVVEKPAEDSVSRP